MADFSVDVLCNATASVLTVVGEVDIEHAEDLAAVGLLTLTSLNGNGEGLIIDLTQVTFMDSTGLGALVTIRNAAQAEGRGVTLHCPSPQVARVLEISGLASVFDISTAEVEISTAHVEPG